VSRVLASFTEGHYYDKGERPNTELADNSPFITGASYEPKIRLLVTIKLMGSTLDKLVFFHYHADFNISMTRLLIVCWSLFARDVTVNNGVINLSYHQIDLGSIYGIYDKATDK
jgi:hypothetical protein